MPHQRQVVDVAGELVRDEDTGFWVPAYSKVGLTIPRQNGKTAMTFYVTLDRSLLWEAFDGKPQISAYTAQNGTDARIKFRNDWTNELKRSPYGPALEKTRMSAEDMSWRFVNGSMVRVFNNSDSAGHGSVLDFGVMDEIFADTTNQREQMMLPAMATRHDSQTFWTSTAGEDYSVILRAEQLKGRAAVDRGANEGVAYFEWSADPKADPEDPKTWWACMPALGYTITERTVHHALEVQRSDKGDLSEFKRAWLNIPNTRSSEQVIPQDIWESVQGDIEPAGDIVFAVDASPDHSHGSIVAVDRNLNCAVVDYRPGVGWLIERTLELVNKKGGSVAVDVTGPIGHLAASFTASGVKVEEFAGRRMAQACGFTVSAIADRQIRVRGHDALNKAVAGAVKVPVGDAWRWGRKNADADVSPLVAMTMGLGVYSVNLGEVNVMFI